MHISVIVCTYKRCDRLAKVLDCLQNLVIPPGVSWEAVVVDNNSPDQTRAVVQQYVDRNPGVFRYLFEGRQGKSFALNTGIAAATGDIIAFTDDDVTIDPQWLAVLVDTFAQRPCVAVAGRIVPVWSSQKPNWFKHEGDIRFMAAIVEYDLGSAPCQVTAPPFGANMAFRRSMFTKYGGFREDIGPNGRDEIRGEDSEFCLRLMRANEDFLYTPAAVVFHPVEEGRASKAYFQAWYYAYGRVTIRTQGVVPGAVRYFGVPRYLFKAALSSALQWQLSVRPHVRFYHKLNLWRIAGEAREAREAAARARAR